MRITVLHNSSAGSGSPRPDELEDWLSRAGHEVRYLSTDEEEPGFLLSHPVDLVVAAGGDGTAATVMRELAGSSVPATILPLGTANNIANALGIHGSPRELITRLSSGQPRAVDVPAMTGPWGVARFVESVGLGLFADFLRDAQAEEHWEGVDTGQLDLRSGRGERMRSMLAQHKPSWRHIEADGVDLSGHCLFVAAFNTPCIGPRLAFAPDADPGDGLLDLLLITENERTAMTDYLGTVDDDPTARLSVPTRKCRELVLHWNAESGHLDDDLWPHSAESAAAVAESGVRIEVGGCTVTVLVPDA